MDKKRLLAALLVLLFIALSLVGIWNLPEDIPTLTSSQIAHAYEAYFTIKHDEEQIKSGTFTVFPWREDSFMLAFSSKPEVIRKERTSREESLDGRKISINTDIEYAFDDFPLAPAEMREIKLKWGEETVVVPVYIQVVARGALVGKKSADFLRNLQEGEHIYKVRVAKTIGGEYQGFSPVNVFSNLPQIKAGYLGRLPEILKYTTTKEWRGDLVRMEFWRILKTEPIHQKVVKEEKLSNEERQAYYKLLDEARKQADEITGSANGVFSQTVLADKGVVFILPVDIEEVDGVKIERRSE